MLKKQRILKKSKDGKKPPDSPQPWYLIFKEWSFWNFFLGILLVLLVIFGGPKFSKWMKNNEENRIWKHGKIITGTLLEHRNMKGDYLKIEYEWGGKKYSFREYTSSYESVPDGTKLLIMVDSTSPEDAFLMGVEAH